MFTVIALTFARWFKRDRRLRRCQQRTANKYDRRNRTRHVAPDISFCRCGVESKNGDAIGAGGDESDEALA